MKFLAAENKGPELKSIDELCANILVLMDATGSMKSLLENAKNKVGEMFKEAREILMKNGIAPDSFKL